jgi:hypothetical protein
MDGAATRRVEGYGRGIERAFGKDHADNCCNVDRIARLPGSVNHKTGHRAKVVVHRSNAVYDLEDFLFADPAGAAFEPGATPKPPAHYAAKKLRGIIAELEPGSRNTTLNSRAFYVGTMIGAGWLERGETEGIIAAAIAHWDDQRKTLSTLRRALRDGEARPHADLDARPVIKLQPGALDKTMVRVEQVLLESGAQIFQRGGALVRHVIEEVAASYKRRTKVARFVRLEPLYTRLLLDRVARFERYDGRSKKWGTTDPPRDDVAATMLARVGEWGFPTVTGVISTPTMRPDGSLLTKPGYDKATGLLLIEPPPMLTIPDAPTRQQVLDAVTMLESLLTEFPLVDEVSKSVALSIMITPVARGAFQMAPMHTTSAPAPGTGKSYIWMWGRQSPSASSCR